MEKRVLFAIVLSFLVLYGWSALNPPPKQINVNATATKSTNNVPTSSEINENTTQIASAIQSTDLAENFQKVFDKKATKSMFETDSLIAELSNLGGVIDQLTIKKYHEKLPFSRILDIIGFENNEFKLNKMSNQEFIYSFSNDLVQIDRHYNLQQEYLIQTKTTVKNITSVPQTISLKFKGYELDFHDAAKVNPHDQSLYEYAGYINEEIIRKANAFKFADKEEKQVAGKVKWVAFRNRYFTGIVKPQFDTTSLDINPETDKTFSLNFSTTNVVLSPGQSAEFPAVIFAGPENLKTLKSYNLEFEKIKNFYNFKLFDAIAKIIYEMLHWIYKIFPNWGVCIILVSTIIYFSVYPLTLSSMASMRKIQALQPKIAALKEKHKDNPQKLNKEMMEIYKEHKINPLGGCLPILLQMPVFIGLYQVLWRDVSFKGADFLWIKDLSEPDKLFILPFAVPFMGNAINLLPILMMIIMFFQTRLQSKNMVITDEAQLMQQKMMMFVMPVFMCFIFYGFASGLTLYFTMFYLYSTLTQWKMSLKPQKV